MKVGWLARTPGPKEQPPQGAVAQPSLHPFELAAVDLITVSGRFSGWIATDGERTSDWLNHNDELLVRGMEAVAPMEQLAEATLPVASGLTEQHLSATDVIFVVPPPLPPNRHLRLHRRRVRIHLELGAYRVSGQLHVRPGANAGDYVLRSTRTMVPLTEVELVHAGDPAFRRLTPVLIVNARHVTRMREAEQRGRPVVIASHPGPAAEPAPPVALRSSAVRPSGARAARDAMAALQTLLDAGLLDITEFQTKRALLQAGTQS